MTIDERLEALTHTVELLALAHRDSEGRIARFEESRARLEQSTARLEESMIVTNAILARLENRVDRLDETVERLAKGTAEAISRLEAVQEVTEQKLQRFLDALARGPNGSR